jgi:hypothetical protein
MLSKNNTSLKIKLRIIIDLCTLQRAYMKFVNHADINYTEAEIYKTRYEFGGRIYAALIRLNQDERSTAVFRP